MVKKKLSNISKSKHNSEKRHEEEWLSPVNVVEKKTRKILVIDDNKKFILSLAHLLLSKNKRYEIISVNLYKKALIKINEHNFDIIVVSNVETTTINKINFLKAIRNINPDIKVIITLPTAKKKIKEEMDISNLSNCVISDSTDVSEVVRMIEDVCLAN